MPLQTLYHQFPKASKVTRTQAEKQKRRRDREKAILSSQSPKDEGLDWSEKEKILYTAQTPPGEKKDTSLPFPAAYSPDYVESSWYQWWEKEGFFRPEQHDSLPHAVERTFSMCIPPPNVTGTLHLGHALTVAVEDALVRWRRMQGHRVLWLPGCDHAGIATQTVVERKLLRESGRRRQDMGRDEFLQEVWMWKNEKGEEIYSQLRRMGASLDWTRACFTMDPGFSRAVTEAFVRLCDSGLIYRSEALINWSCALQSAISDIEVDSKELSGRTMLPVPGYERPVEFGTMLTFAYPIEGHDGEVAVSTTRPETMLGDVAIAVHPEDPRYQAVHGKQCRHPFTGELLPIITDSMVDMQLGTGAVKVTPAHDHTDFLLSQRHSLPYVTVIGEDGTMTPPSLFGFGWCFFLQGVKRFDARQMVVEALVEKRLFRGKQQHSMTLPVCSRSGDIIEPLLKKQWFVQCKGMAAKAIQAVEDGELEIIPQFYSKTWKNWLSNVSDWCVSRQLWWGHQIPAYSVELPQNVNHKEELWVWGRSEEEARQRASVKYGVPPEKITLTQDPDVLDTWFSSGLFPFAMLGWPQQTKDMERFYPNALLETGSDLIFFWVARMVMLGTELTGQLPFKQVLLHSLVRDKHGRKMSKSLGNVVDPLDVIHGTSLEKLQEKVRAGNLDPREQLVAMEAQSKDFPRGIPQCGTDALRFALCSHKTQGEIFRTSSTISKDSEGMSRGFFCLNNNAFLLLVLWVQVGPLGSMERWVLSRLYSTVLQCEQSFEAYELHSVTSALYTFWVNSLCDVYMEYMKPLLSPQTRATEGAVACSVLFHCVSVSLALLSPFMPFITEELWQRLQLHHPPASATAQPSLCLQPYPSSQSLARWHFPDEERDFLWVQDVVRVTRSLRAQSGVTKKKPTSELWVECSSAQAKILQDFSPALRTLSRVSTVQLVCPVPGGDMPQLTPRLRLPKAAWRQWSITHADGVNVDRQIAELTQRRDRLVPKLEQLLARVRSKDYQTKVPSHVREALDKKVRVSNCELAKLLSVKSP
uniref:Valine--tRNA ligase, mitochondrial n=1 Tax=Neogobius melanostomus TaxID=47308 RepID=A0A8C6U9V9_9GOBI